MSWESSWKFSEGFSLPMKREPRVIMMEELLEVQREVQKVQSHQQGEYGLGYTVSLEGNVTYLGTVVVNVP